MLKILQARLQQYVNQELPDVQAGFRKSKGAFLASCQHLLDHRKSKGVPEKHALLLYWLCQSLWLCGSWQTVENSSRDGNTRSPDLPPEKYMQQEATGMEEWTGFKRGKEYVKAVCCILVYLTYMQSTLCKMPGWMKHNLESRLPGEISITLGTQMTPPLWHKEKRN